LQGIGKFFLVEILIGVSVAKFWRDVLRLGLAVANWLEFFLALTGA
jgi:hypothetical protein